MRVRAKGCPMPLMPLGDFSCSGTVPLRIAGQNRVVVAITEWDVVNVCYVKLPQRIFGGRTSVEAVLFFPMAYTSL